MEKKFERGDVVKLKSGSPDMTVVEYEMWHDIVNAVYGKETRPSHETEMVKCKWFEKTKVKAATFHQDLLELVKK